MGVYNVTFTMMGTSSIVWLVVGLTRLGPR